MRKSAKRELPSASFHGRLTQAVQVWEATNQRIGRGGNQTELHRAIMDAFGNEAPSREALSKWVRGSYVPSLDYCLMLSEALGVRPGWLAFDDGPMTDTEIEPSTSGPIDEVIEKLRGEGKKGRRTG